MTRDAKFPLAGWPLHACELLGWGRSWARPLARLRQWRTSIPSSISSGVLESIQWNNVLTKRNAGIRRPKPRAFLEREGPFTSGCLHE